MLKTSCFALGYAAARLGPMIFPLAGGPPMLITYTQTVSREVSGLR